MIAYLDSSVILRKLFRQPNSFEAWGEWERAVTSEITRIESLRAVDRIRLEGRMTDTMVPECVQSLLDLLTRIDDIALGKTVLYRASLAYPTVIGTLDAIHLSSALIYKENFRKDVLFLTHDRQLGNAALSVGLKVEGIETLKPV